MYHNIITLLIIIMMIITPWSDCRTLAQGLSPLRIIADDSNHITYHVLCYNVLEGPVI